jgi:hypothetical protein
MLKRTLYVSTLLSILTITSPSYAALTKSSGLYVDGNFGFRNGAEVAATFDAGYKFNNNLGVEGGVDFLSSTYIDVAAKGIIPFDNGFELFAKLGGTFDLHLFGGLGVGYAFTPNLSATLQGIVVSDDSTPYALTLGLGYIF